MLTVWLIPLISFLLVLGMEMAERQLGGVPYFSVFGMQKVAVLLLFASACQVRDNSRVPARARFPHLLTSDVGFSDQFYKVRP